MFTQTKQVLEAGKVKLNLEFSLKAVNITDEITFESEELATRYSLLTHIDLLKFSFEFLVSSIPGEKIKRVDFTEAYERLQRANNWFVDKDLRTLVTWIVKLKNDLLLMLNISANEEMDYKRKFTTTQLLDHCLTLQ